MQQDQWSNQRQWSGQTHHQPPGGGAHWSHSADWEPCSGGTGWQAPAAAPGGAGPAGCRQPPGGGGLPAGPGAAACGLLGCGWQGGGGRGPPLGHGRSPGGCGGGPPLGTGCGPGGCGGPPRSNIGCGPSGCGGQAGPGGAWSGWQGPPGDGAPGDAGEWRLTPPNAASPLEAREGAAAPGRWGAQGGGLTGTRPAENGSRPRWLPLTAPPGQGAAEDWGAAGAGRGVGPATPQGLPLTSPPGQGAREDREDWATASEDPMEAGRPTWLAAAANPSGRGRDAPGPSRPPDLLAEGRRQGPPSPEGRAQIGVAERGAPPREGTNANSGRQSARQSARHRGGGAEQAVAAAPAQGRPAGPAAAPARGRNGAAKQGAAAQPRAGGLDGQAAGRRGSQEVARGPQQPGGREPSRQQPPRDAAAAGLPAQHALGRNAAPRQETAVEEGDPVAAAATQTGECCAPPLTDAQQEAWMRSIAWMDDDEMEPFKSAYIGGLNLDPPKVFRLIVIP